MAKILVIDDDASVAEALSIALLKSRHEVSIARNGKEGLAKFKSNPAEVVITDMLMPDVDGFEVIRDFRRHFPEVRIIAISGGGKMSPGLYLQMAEQIGASHTLVKPFSVDELLATIESALRA